MNITQITNSCQIVKSAKNKIILEGETLANPKAIKAAFECASKSDVVILNGVEKASDEGKITLLNELHSRNELLVKLAGFASVKCNEAIAKAKEHIPVVLVLGKDSPYPDTSFLIAGRLDKILRV